MKCSDEVRPAAHTDTLKPRLTVIKQDAYRISGRTRRLAPRSLHDVEHAAQILGCGDRGRGLATGAAPRCHSELIVDLRNEKLRGAALSFCPAFICIYADRDG
jgi:hypothetical protein